MQLSTYLSRLGLRRAAAGAAALLLACAPLVACSSDSDDNPLGIPTYDPEAMASAEASESAAAAAASASASAAAPTLESLSDQELGYHMVSIPEDLTEAQTKALVDYVAYDQVTWRIWSTGEGIENLPTVATGTYLAHLQEEAELLSSKGERDNPPVRVAITEVSVAEDGTYAEITECNDQTQVTTVDANGNDITDPNRQLRFEVNTVMTPADDGTWLATAETTTSTNECAVE